MAKKSLVGKKIGDHQVLEVIGEGAFGTTYKAKDLTCGGIDCLKDCSNVKPEYAFKLAEEFKLARRLRHHSLPAMRRLIKLDDGTYAIIMSYIPGWTLEQIVKKVGPVPAKYLCWIVDRTLNALKYMHFHGAMHGDIKPQNIIVRQKSHTIGLIDFGLAMSKPKPGDESAGYTPLYSSPEQRQGKLILPESDLYSLGKTMIYALGGGVDAVKNDKVSDDTPDPLCDFIVSLLQENVNDRPNWDKKIWNEKLKDNIDLFSEFQQVRVKSFGELRSGMMQLPGIPDEEEEE